MLPFAEIVLAHIGCGFEVSNNKGANLILPKGTSPTDEYIINKVRSFNIESKTPMDCMMFLVDLKKKINGEV